MMKKVVIEGLKKGGKMMIKKDVEKYKGYEEKVKGKWMMEKMERKDENVGEKIVNEIIKEVEKNVRKLSMKGD